MLLIYHLCLKKATSKQKKIPGFNLKNGFFSEFIQPVTGRLCKTGSPCVVLHQIFHRDQRIARKLRNADVTVIIFNGKIKLFFIRSKVHPAHFFAVQTE